VQRTLYGLLPLVWALLLARHLPIGMAEAGMVLPVTGLAMAPFWSADPHVIGFCQTGVVLGGLVAAFILLRRQLGNSVSLWLSASCLALLIAWGGRWLVGGIFV